MKTLIQLQFVVLVVISAAMANGVVQSIAPPAVVFEALALNHDIGTKKKPKYRSPTALVPSHDGTTMYIAEQTAKRIAVYNLEAKSVEGYVQCANEVTGIALSPDGETLYATLGSELWPGGMVAVIDVAGRKVTHNITEGIGHYPLSPVVTPGSGEKLYVCNLFSNNLSVVNTATSKVVKVVDLIREPYAAAITPDGRRLLIGNSLPDDRSTDSEEVSCQITIYDTEADATLKNLRLTRGSHSIFGVAVSPDGKYGFATHLIGKFNLIGSTVTGGWLHTNNIAVIDIEKQQFLNDVTLDFANQGMANPWGVTVASKGLPPDSTFLLVAHAGANAVSMIHYQPFIKKVLEASAAGDDLQRTFTFLLEDVRKVVNVKSKGIRTLATVGQWVYTAGFFDDPGAKMEQHYLTLNTRRGSFPDSVLHTIGEPIARNAERQGELNFYDAELCIQEWQSCHSCHPLTRPDALNWILSSSVGGTPKNAKSMLYAWWTPPTTWRGRRVNAQNSIIAGVQIELAQTPRNELTVPMDTFFMYLKPMPSPFLVKGRLSESARRGKVLYYNKTKVDCIECHKGPLFFDDKVHDAGVEDVFDQNAINTPGLTECWRTAPYGHLGSFTGMQEILELEAHSNMRKNIIDGILTAQDINDLVEYVMSL